MPGSQTGRGVGSPDETQTPQGLLRLGGFGTAFPNPAPDRFFEPGVGEPQAPAERGRHLPRHRQQAPFPQLVVPVEVVVIPPRLEPFRYGVHHRFRHGPGPVARLLDLLPDGLPPELDEVRIPVTRSHDPLQRRVLDPHAAGGERPTDRLRRRLVVQTTDGRRPGPVPERRFDPGEPGAEVGGSGQDQEQRSLPAHRLRRIQQRPPRFRSERVRLVEQQQQRSSPRPHDQRLF